ncbi:MAG TPA: M48 family metalloprotease [Gemmatimonadales bacterium]|nr:M48 family metalloprotease [Gemmatimonadales bacterium]
MDALEFQALVERLERDSARNAASYRRRVAGLAVLGYAYVFGMLIVLIALAAGVAAAMIYGTNIVLIKLLIGLLVLIGAVVSALWVKMTPPGGFLLTREATPALFELIDRTSAALHAPPVHDVVVDASLNAAIVQVPRFGPFGWYRNYLLIGLPLLQATDPDEWRAILAHEMGHLSGNHGRFGSWVYRVRKTWNQLLAAVEKKRSRIGTWLFGRFLAWYAPYFDAYTFVVARRHEYDADRAAADLAGADVARRALLRLDAAARVMEERFWPDLMAGAGESAEPPTDTFGRLGIALRTPPATEDAARWITASWQRVAGVNDTHPSLADRLRALGWNPTGGDATEPPPPPPITGPTADEAFLGALATPLREAIDQAWAKGAAESWRQQHEKVRRELDRVAALDAREAGSLSVEEEWERIDLLADLGDQDRAAALNRALLERAPEHPGARFYLGRILLADGDPAGVEYIEGVMRDEPSTTLAGCQVLYAYYQGRGDTTAAARCLKWAEEYSGELEKAREERRQLPKGALVEPHGLPDEAIAALRTQLEKLRRVKRAYLVRRRVKWLPDRPAYALCLKPRGMFTTRKRHRRIVDEVAQGVRGPEGMVVFIASDGRVPRRIRKQKGARVI